MLDGTPDEIKEKKNLTLILLSNIAQCCLCLDEPNKAVSYCEKAVNVDVPKQKKIKAYYRC